ncbi:MAG: putative regulator of cell autolysis [Eubacterium sp.]|nr:putative regulator of cell autolysis [Eubacterium sp.]
MRVNVKQLTSSLITVGVIFIIFFILYYITSPFSEKPKVENGRLDLSNWEFVEDGAAAISGSWEFYPQRLLSPDKLPTGSTDMIIVPGQWESKTSLSQPSKGSATYNVKVILPEHHKHLALKVQNIWMSHRLFINGKLVKEMGRPSESPDSNVSKNTPYIVIIDPADELDICIQVTNYKYYTGGIVHPVLLGDVEEMEKSVQFSVGSDMAGFFLFLLFGVYHIHIYQMRGKEPTYLYSGIYMILMSFTIITSGEKLLMKLADNMPFEVLYRFQDLCISLSFPILVFFIRSFQSDTINRRMSRIIIIPTMIYPVLVLAAPFNFYIELKPYITIYGSIMLFFLAFRLTYILVRNQKNQADKIFSNELKYVVVCIAFIAVMFFDSIIYYSSMSSNNLIGRLSQMGFLISLNLLMARRFTNNVNKVEALSDKLEKANKIKDEFLFRTSHGLKFPLQEISNITNHLMLDEQTALTPKQRKNLALMLDTSKKLSIMVNDMTDVIRLRYGDISLNITTVDLYVACQIIFQLLSFNVKGRELKLVNSIDSMTFVEVDENRLRQILYNVVSNAINDCQYGVIEARSVVKDGAVLLALSIAGIGINGEEWEKKFEDPYETDAIIGNPKNGSGLGLYISRQLARKMGGDIWISELEVGTGVIVNVRLPEGVTANTLKINNENDFDIVNSAATGQEKPYLRDKPEKELKHILIVDDNASNIHVLSLILEEDFKISVAHNGNTALEMVKNNRIDIVITDMIMPGMSGIELTQNIRRYYSVIKLPVIISIIRSSTQEIELAYQAGANDYISLPFTAEEVKFKVKGVLQLTDAMEMALRNENAFLQAQIKPHFIYNALSNIIALCYEDGERAAELLSLLSRYLRFIFQTDSSFSKISINQELDIIKAYVEIEKLRFGERLQYEVYVDEELLEEELPIPPLLLQPLIENSIRHGLFNKIGQGKVSLSITQGDGFVYMVVEDDGVGIGEDQLYRLMNEDGGKGVGIKNIRKRVGIYSGASFSIDSELDKGTKCKLFLPKA